MQHLTRTFSASAAALAFSAALANAQGYTPGTSYINRAPEAGSEQAELLAPYIDFINNMGCCSDRDGRAMVEEIPQPENEKFPYVVMRHETVDGLRLSEPFAISVPFTTVRDLEDYERSCRNTIERAEAAGEDHTCTPPPYNVIWAYDNIRYDENKKLYINTDDRTKTYEPDDVIPVEDYRITSLYCYFPQPNF